MIKSFILVGAMLPFFWLTAQTNATIRGHVMDAETGAPVPFATVLAQPANIGTASDASGFYSLNLPTGPQRLFFSFIGFDTLSVLVDLREKQILYQPVKLYEQGISLEIVEVSAQDSRRRREINLATQLVGQESISKLPSLGVQGDIAQYITVLPGVVSAGEQGGQVYIAGGTPSQSLIKMDGITLVSPFHSLSGFSVIPTEMIQQVEVMGAAFNSTYGNRISSVIDIQLKERFGNDWQAHVAIDPFVAQAYLHAPLLKSTKEDGVSVHLVLHGKQSLIDQTAPSIYSHIEGGIPFKFNDLQSKLTVQTGGGNVFYVEALTSTDAVRLPDEASYEWDQTGGVFGFKLLPPQSALIISGQFSFSDYGTFIQTERARRSEYSQFSGRLSFDYFGNEDQLTYGFDFEGAQTDLEFENFAGVTIERVDNTSDISGFINYQRTFANRVIVEPGIRAPYYASLGTFSFEPRLGIKFLLNDQLRLKMGTGRYSQNFLSTRSTGDVVNFFNGYLSSPDGLLRNLDGETLSSNLQKSTHLLVGVELDITAGLRVNIEAYRKWFSPLLEVNRNKRLSSEADYVVEVGESTGITASIEYARGPWDVFINYGWLTADRQNGMQSYAADFDRRHQINALASCEFGKNESWNLSARWSLGSGFPFTRTQLFFDRILFEEGIETNVITENGGLGILFEDQLNVGRLPYYHRLDMAVRKRWTIGKSTKMEVGLSAVNTYDRANIFYFDRIKYQRVDQFPFIPTLGAKISF